MKREYINELVENTNCSISGRAVKIRDTKYMIFIILKDITGEIQVSIDKANMNSLVEKMNGILPHSIIKFTGKMVMSEYVKNGGKEFIPEDLEVLSSAEALPIDETANLDTRLDYRFIDLRSDKNNLMLKVQSTMTNAMREYLVNDKFTEIHTPKLIGTASESGSEVFEVKYFDTVAYLAQSPQFYKQMAIAAGLERVVEVGPVFRAEKSNSYRHATEFTGFDLEFAYINSYTDVMDKLEEILVVGLTKVKELYGAKIKELFDIDVVVPTRPFPRIKLNDLYQELNKRYGFTIPTEDVGDMNSEAETLTSKFAMEEYGHEFIFITDYNITKRPFYHMRKDGIPQGFDLIWRGTELTSGSQREHRYDILKKQAEEKGLTKDVEFYLTFFQYGCPPHGGFGIGVDRMTMLLLGTPSLKETQFLFRGPNRIRP